MRYGVSRLEAAVGSPPPQKDSPDLLDRILPRILTGILALT